MRSYFLNFKEGGAGNRDFIQIRLLHSNDLIDCVMKLHQIIMLRGACKGAHKGACWPTHRGLHRGVYMGAHRGIFGGKERYM